MGAGHASQYSMGSDHQGEKISLDLSLITDNIPHLDKTEVIRILLQYGISISSHVLQIVVHDVEKVFSEVTKKSSEVSEPVIATDTTAFVNWSETQKFPSHICYPNTKDDIVSILNHPKYKGKKIGLLGSAYSWENLFGESETVLINFVRFNSLEESNKKRVKIVDLDKCIVSVSGGCTILEKHGVLGIERDPMLLPSCVVCTDAHYAGISSTGCHGCGFNEGTLSDRIRRITFLDAAGEEHVLDIENNERELRAAAIGLGSFGIITELQFKMIPEMLVVIESHYWTLSQMKYHLINRPSDWISFEHFWWPFGSVSLIDAFECLTTGRLTNYDYQQDKVYCRIVRHYRDPYDHKYPYFEKASKSYIYPDQPYGGFQELKGKRDFVYYFQEILVWLRKYFFRELENDSDLRSKLIPEKFTPLAQVVILKLLKQLQFWQDFGRPRVSSYFNAVHYLPLVSSLPVRLNNIELCFRASSQHIRAGVKHESFDNYLKALNELGVRIQDEAYYGRFPVNMCVESRICGNSPCPLAACYSERPQLFCYIDLLSSIHTPTWENFGNEFFQIIKSIDPRVKPALGKQWVLIDGIYEHLREVCKEGLAELRRLQHKYDKTGRFMSPAVAKLFEV